MQPRRSTEPCRSQRAVSSIRTLRWATTCSERFTATWDRSPQRENLTKAFQLRERGRELERLYISAIRLDGLW